MDAIEKAGEPRVGIVYDFGNPKKDDPQLHLKKGQRVCIKKYVSSPLFVVELGMSFIFVDYDDITAIMVETEGEGKGE